MREHEENERNQAWPEAGESFPAAETSQLRRRSAFEAGAFDEARRVMPAIKEGQSGLDRTRLSHKRLACRRDTWRCTWESGRIWRAE